MPGYYVRTWKCPDGQDDVWSFQPWWGLRCRCRWELVNPGSTDALSQIMLLVRGLGVGAMSPELCSFLANNGGPHPR